MLGSCVCIVCVGLDSIVERLLFYLNCLPSINLMFSILLQFDWLRYLQSVFIPVNKSITPAENVVVYAPEYLANMITIVNKTSNR